jgi:hypothetical protein
MRGLFERLKFGQFAEYVGMRYVGKHFFVFVVGLEKKRIRIGGGLWGMKFPDQMVIDGNEVSLFVEGDGKVEKIDAIFFVVVGAVSGGKVELAFAVGIGQTLRNPLNAL